ncbi:hypothetical protein TZ02_10750 [Clostridium aceticum]|nr:hypothetical protein TZ02_10750 [Clostridium aceticum]
MKAIQGNKSAFSILFKEYYNTSYRISRSILKNDSDIEDALQEAAIKAYKNIIKLKDADLFKPWFIRIVINESYNVLKRKTHLPLDTLINCTSIPNEICNDIDIKNAILNLDDDLRLVTVLYYYEDLSIKSISKLLNIPEGTVKSRLYRARNSLYDILNIKEDI